MTSRRIRIGDWTATPALNVLESAERSVEIEPRAMDLLVFLAEHAGDVLSTSDLIAEVWHGRVVGDHAVYRLIQRLRAALEDDSQDPHYIATVPRRGYRLIAAVELLHEPQALPMLAGLRVLAQQSRLRTATVLVGGLVCLAVLAASLWSPLDTNRLDGQTIAVLPFQNLSGDAAEAYLGEGIAGEVIHALSNGSGLRVIARTSSFSFRDDSVGISEIAERLSASVILEGTVRRENDRLRVIAQLVDTDSGDYLWSDNFDRSIGDLITIERDIALAVAERLMGEAADTERIAAALPPLDDITAYEYYLLGRERMRIPSGISREWSLTDANQAIEYFRRAIAADPNFARAYTGLADALLGRAMIGTGPANAELDETVAEEVLEAIGRAETLAPNLAEVRVSRGLALHSLEQDSDGAYELYREAIALDPNLVTAYYRLARGVQGEEGVAALRSAVELDPLSAELHLWLARLLRDTGRSEAADSHLVQAMRLDNPPVAAFLLTANHRAEVGRPDEAIRLLEPLIDDPRFEQHQARIRLVIATNYLDLEDYRNAEAWLKPIEQTDAAIDVRIRLALAQDRDQEAAELNHRAQSADFAVLWEMLLGHDDHARALAVLEPKDAVNATFLSDYIGWGYHPAVNAARLEIDAGNLQSAEALLAVARRDTEVHGKDRYTTPGAQYLSASIAAIKGNTDDALASLEQAVASGWLRAWYAARDPNVESLRGEPRFQAAIAGMRTELERLRTLL